MILDPDFAEVGEPIVTLRMSKSQAEYAQSGLSDLLCWCRGFMAGRGEDFHYEPIGVTETRELNIAIKKAIEAAK